MAPIEELSGTPVSLSSLAEPQETSLTARGGNLPCIWSGDFPEPKLSPQRAGRTFGHGQFNQKRFCLTTSHSLRSGART